MQISDEVKQVVLTHMQYDPESGSLKWKSDGSTPLRLKWLATGKVAWYVIINIDMESYELDAASCCWLLKKGVWPEHGVEFKSTKFIGSDILRWSNLKKRSKRAEVKATTVTVQRDLLDRVLRHVKLMLSERMTDDGLTERDEVELQFMKEIEEVLR
jgi:hypothetical protein